MQFYQAFASANTVACAHARTAQQRAEREQTAKRAREEDAAARAEVLRRRAIARTTAREEARARQLPTAAAGAVLR